MALCCRTGAQGSRLYRRPQRRDQISLGRWSLRPITCVGHRVSGRSSGRHRYAHARGCAGRQSCDQNYPDRIRDRCRPGHVGLVSSLNHPGSNVTGISFLVNTLESKRLELVPDLLPSATVVGFLVNPTNPASQSQTRDAQVAAGALGLKLLVFNAKNEGEIDAAFTSLVEQRVNTVIVGADGYFANRRDQLVGLAARHAIPAIYWLRELAIAGGLMSYGTDITDALRLTGVYAGRILKGEKPADLPVQQTVKFELVINLKAAKALGLDVPAMLLARADEVIE